MADAELPGRRLLPDDLHIADQQAFLKQVPTLITQLRMRKPSLAFSLNLSESSLPALDQEIAACINELPGGYRKIAYFIDRDLLRQVAAYVGEVIVRNRNGQWRLSTSEIDDGPEVAFPRYQRPDVRVTEWKVIGIYDHVLVTIIEGDTLARWYSAEVLDDNRP